MTFVGKILVVFITLFAMVFLAVSVVVFSTATNWKEATQKERTKFTDYQKKNTDQEAMLKQEVASLEKAKADHAAAVKLAEARIETLQNDIKQAQGEITAAQGNLEKLNQSNAVALAEAAQRRSETEQIRTQKSEVEKQANEFKIRQTELVDKIREIERQNKTLDDNNKDLRDRVARFSTLLRRAGLSDDITTVKGLESPPPVEGELTKVDNANKKVEMSIGSDDGLVVGHELFVFRTKPLPQYLGKIQIMAVDPDKAVGKVVGRTVQGIKLQEGDIVSSTIRR